MHLHPCMCAYATVQKLLCHGNYCELILSPVRASFKQPSAARPATGPTNSVAHPSIRGEQRRRRTMSAQQIAPNPRQLITRSPPRCRTSIIQSSALVQASFSLSMVALAAQPRRSSPKNFYFGHFSPRVHPPFASGGVELFAESTICHYIPVARDRTPWVAPGGGARV